MDYFIFNLYFFATWILIAVGVIAIIIKLPAKDSTKSKSEALNIPRVINWVAVTERMPEEEWGDYMVCLKNNAIFKANYSRIGTERWLIVGVGDTKDTNPVRYWAELPEPPCL